MKAISVFLGSIDDEETVLKYREMMGGILDVLIEVLKEDEEQGLKSIDSLIELTNSHGDIWSQVMDKLLFVVSEVMKNKQFEDKTR